MKRENLPLAFAVMMLAAMTAPLQIPKPPRMPMQQIKAAARWTQARNAATTSCWDGFLN